MSGITTHVLDTSRGRPGTGIDVVLEQLAGGQWEEIEDELTRTAACERSDESNVPARHHRLTFDTAAFFRAPRLQPSIPGDHRFETSDVSTTMCHCLEPV